jgi:hypothetical protein
LDLHSSSVLQPAPWLPSPTTTGLSASGSPPASLLAEEDAPLEDCPELELGPDVPELAPASSLPPAGVASSLLLQATKRRMHDTHETPATRAVMRILRCYAVRVT